MLLTVRRIYSWVMASLWRFVCLAGLWHGFVCATRMKQMRGPRQYCEAEVFRAKCDKTEAVVMETARYGRMEQSRCVVKNYGFLGCESEREKVLEVMDSQCSGRRHCEVRLPDTTLDKLKTKCPQDFKTYLEASFGCVPITSAFCRSCVNATYVRALEPRGYLASIITEETGCGTVGCPWVLSAQPGQRLNITLWDFTKSSAPYGGGVGSSCFRPYRFATIRERWRNDEKIICGGSARERHVYLSEKHSIEIQFDSVTRDRPETNDHFMLFYEVLGCADYRPPRNTWMKRRGNQVTVGCISTGKQWHLHCKGSRWTGHLDLCPIAPGSLDDDPNSINGLPVGILIAIIVAIALIIGVFILTVGLVLIKRRRMAESVVHTPTVIRPHYPDGREDPYFQRPSTRPSISGCSTPATKKSGPSMREKYPPVGFNEGDYAYNMEMRPLPSLPNIHEATERERERERSRPEPLEFPRMRSSLVEPDTEHTYCSSPKASQNHGYSRDPELGHPMGPHYFELDPDGFPVAVSKRSPGRPPVPPHGGNIINVAPHGGNINNNGSAHALATPHVTTGTGRVHKSPEQENEENIGKESLHCNNSLQDVSSCSGQQSLDMDGFRETGNCSWP